MRNGPWGDRIPTREEAIEGAAAVYLEAKLRIETEKAIERLHQENAPAVAATADEGENSIQEGN